MPLANRASRTFESTILTRSQHPLQGIAFLIAAVAFFAVFDTLTKYISITVPVVMALWFRYLFQMVATGATLLPSRGVRCCARAGRGCRWCAGCCCCWSACSRS